MTSSQRLVMLRDFANFGLDHWGSDDYGVNKTRAFVLELLSFLYRYIPVGLLQTLPPRMADRAPPFKGRDDLETLMVFSSLLPLSLSLSLSLSLVPLSKLTVLSLACGCGGKRPRRAWPTG